MLLASNDAVEVWTWGCEQPRLELAQSLKQEGGTARVMGLAARCGPFGLLKLFLEVAKATIDLPARLQDGLPLFLSLCSAGRWFPLSFVA